MKPLVSLDDLYQTFKKRMNPRETVPTHFNQVEQGFMNLMAETIPETTIDESPTGSFSRVFVEADIIGAKKRLAKKKARSSTGIDQVSYQTILRIPNEVLVRLFNNYRLVALESCLLKMLTLLIDGRFQEWMTLEGIVPASQNGFREG
ncbi:hypothetical protein C8J56DRAFT_786320 [Mycena floridula]|nr:hypothetical protein C8J56DRAFT_786320 [Mycena floridula]